MTVHIMAGAPGCGKSVLAKKLCNPNNMDCIFSADDFFMQDGEYKFDASKLSLAHNRCLRNFAAELHSAGFGEHNLPNFIVDNTNSSIAEIAPYYALARAYGHEVVIHWWQLDRHQVEHFCFPRNIHQVPLRTCLKIGKAVFDLEFPLFWDAEFKIHTIAEGE